MMNTEIEISLFPIPGSVSLPFHTVPLHIFEPRYRKMVRDSVEKKRRIGIAHTIREIAPSKVSSGATDQEILNSNLESYEAHTIFSAGFAKISEVLPDGRLIVEIEMDSRYEVIEEVQQVPYKVVKCIPYQDVEIAPKISDLLRKKLDQRLLSLEGSGTEALKKFLLNPSWTSQNTDQYSFAIFSLIQLKPDFVQMVLEMKSAEDRITFLLDLFEHKTGFDN
jgi:Lon protease-like protein